MNDTDPIVDEVRRIRDAHAAQFNYDPQAIYDDIKKRERQSGRHYISYPDAVIEKPGCVLPPKNSQPSNSAVPASCDNPRLPLNSDAKR